MTATQATKQLLDMGCVFLSITDIEKNTILQQQQNKAITTAEIKKQAEKINTYLKTAPNGTYFIEGKMGARSKATRIQINIGNVAPSNDNAVQPAQPMADHAANNVLSYNNALALQNTIAKLEAENTRLLLLVQEYEEDIAAMEEAEPQQMAESPAMSAIGAVAPIIPGMIDHYFKAQKERLEFEKMKFYEEMKAKEAQRQQQYQSNGNGEYGSL